MEKFCFIQPKNLKLGIYKQKNCSKFLIDKFSPLLPFDLRWNDIDGHCLSLIHELYILLDNNYIEDNYSFLRFNYIHEFIKLAICSPKWELGLNLGLKFNRSRKINGFISSNFRKIIVENTFLLCSEINLLCLHKKLRKKIFVQELIKEITRRLNCFGIINAIYTTGLTFLKSFLTTSYFYLPLNSMDLCHLYQTPVEKYSPEKKKLSIKKEAETLKFLKNMKKFFKKKKVYKHFNLEDFIHWIRFIGGFKFTFSTKSSLLDKKISVMSFYCLPCKTIRSRKPCYFYDAYFYYGIQLKKNEIFIREIINICKQMGFDMLYILEGSYSNEILLNLKFKQSSSQINFYMVGNKSEQIVPLENGLIFF